MTHTFRVPRSRAWQTQESMRAEIEAALAPVLYGESAAGYAVRGQLERDFAAAVSADHAIAVHSGTIALYIALRACGPGAGDEVITVANSDISTTGAIHQCGATAVLCDVLESDYTMDTAQVESLITPRTRALLPVDMHRHPADVKALREIADQHGLRIIEDAALASGARDYGQPLGAYADVAMYSFAPYKPLGSAGNGAMLVTNDAALEAGLAGTDAITPTFRSESEPTFRSYCIRVPNQAEMHKGLREAGIEAVIHYAPPVHRYSVYKDSFAGRAELPVTDMLAEQIVNLPVTPELTEDEVAYMIEVVRRLL